MAKQIKVVSIEEGGIDIVPSSKIEAAIAEMLSKGWSFLQLCTGGVGAGDLGNTWVYIVFERPS